MLVEGANFPLDNNINQITSCFFSKSNYIWTMGAIEEDHKSGFYIIIYSPLNLQNHIDMHRFEAPPFYERTFFKIIHLKDDIGVGVFFSFLILRKIKMFHHFHLFLQEKWKEKK